MFGEGMSHRPFKIEWNKKKNLGTTSDQHMTQGQDSLVYYEKYLFVYYEEIKRELNRRPMYEYRCDERLNAEAEGSTLVPHIHWVVCGTGTPKDRNKVNRREVC